MSSWPLVISSQKNLQEIQVLFGIEYFQRNFIGIRFYWFLFLGDVRENTRSNAVICHYRVCSREKMWSFFLKKKHGWQEREQDSQESTNWYVCGVLNFLLTGLHPWSMWCGINVSVANSKKTESTVQLYVVAHLRCYPGHNVSRPTMRTQLTVFVHGPCGERRVWPMFQRLHRSSTSPSAIPPPKKTWRYFGVQRTSHLARGRCHLRDRTNRKAGDRPTETVDARPRFTLWNLLPPWLPRNLQLFKRPTTHFRRCQGIPRSAPLESKTPIAG